MYVSVAGIGAGSKYSVVSVSFIGLPEIGKKFSKWYWKFATT